MPNRYTVFLCILCIHLHKMCYNKEIKRIVVF